MSNMCLTWGMQSGDHQGLHCWMVPQELVLGQGLQLVLVLEQRQGLEPQQQELEQLPGGLLGLPEFGDLSGLPEPPASSQTN